MSSSTDLNESERQAWAFACLFTPGISFPGLYGNTTMKDNGRLTVEGGRYFCMIKHQTESTCVSVRKDNVTIYHLHFCFGGVVYNKATRLTLTPEEVFYSAVWQAEAEGLGLRGLSIPSAARAVK